MVRARSRREMDSSYASVMFSGGYWGVSDGCSDLASFTGKGFVSFLSTLFICRPYK